MLHSTLGHGLRGRGLGHVEPVVSVKHSRWTSTTTTTTTLAANGLQTLFVLVWTGVLKVTAAERPNPNAHVLSSLHCHLHQLRILCDGHCGRGGQTAEFSGIEE